MKKLLLAILLLAGMSLPAHAIVTSTLNKNVLACDGTSTTFQYTFPIIDTTYATDLQVSTVTTAGVQTILTTNYSVNTQTGTVTYPVTGSACAIGTNIVLLRTEPLTQGVAASYQGPGPTPPVMNMSDKLTMITQQLQEQINRSILAPITSTSNAGYYLPPPVADAYIGWDPTGTFLTNYITQGLTAASTPTFAGLTLTGFGGMLKASMGGMVGIATVGTDYTSPSDTETLTNKTFDTASNTFKVNGATVSGSLTGNQANVVTATSIQGSSGVIASTSGSLTSGHCVSIDSSSNFVDSGGACSATGATLSGSIGGTSNQVVVTSNSNTIGSNVTLSLPQSIATSSSPTFAGLTVGSITGLIKASSGTLAHAASGTDYAPATTGSSILKANSGGFTNAVSGTDYAPATSGGSILKGNGSGGFSNAVAGADYAPSTTGTNILYGNGTGGFAQANVGAGLIFSGGTLSAAQGFVPNNIQVFTSSGTWTNPGNVNKVYVKVIGAGGGGGGKSAASGSSAGGGGGAGGYAEGVISVTGNVTVTIGGGGAGGAGAGAGGTGGTSSFAGTTTIQATGGTSGTGGAGNTNGNIGSDGVGSNGTLNLGALNQGNNTTGDSPFFGFGLGGSPANSNGNVGAGYGSGGGGGVNTGTGQATGGNGAGGIVIVYY